MLRKANYNSMKLNIRIKTVTKIGPEEEYLNQAMCSLPEKPQLVRHVLFQITKKSVWGREWFGSK
jgi:hypothetical protein